MQKDTKQCYAIKFFLEIQRIYHRQDYFFNQSYGDATLSRTAVFKWQKAFKEDRETVKDDSSSGKRGNDVSHDGERLTIKHQNDCKRNGLE